MIEIDFFHHDLLQLLKGPQLLSSCHLYEVARECKLDLDALMSRPSNTKNQNLRLGKYVEDLFITYLRNHKDIDELNHNLQVSENSNTIGEIDYLFQYQDQCYHWELAYKFYLLHEHQSQLAYYGPQGKDRLDLKVNKLSQHQLPLVQHPQLKPLIDQYEKPIQSQIYMKGWIFYHMLRPTIPPNFPKLNPQHQKGWWLFQKEFHNFSFDPSFSFLNSEKSRWLSLGSAIKRIQETLCFHDYESFVKQHFYDQSRALMTIIFNSDQVEISRGFIVPDHWPEI